VKKEAEFEDDLMVDFLAREIAGAAGAGASCLDY